MSILAANFIAKLSFNLQPRLVSLPWLKRCGVRCFAHDADDPGFPVRYIPKKRPDVKQEQSSTYRDSSHKDGMPTSSDSNMRGQNTVDKRSNVRTRKSSARVSLGAEHGLKQASGYGKGVVDNMRPLEEVGEESGTGNGIGQGQQDKWDREISFSNGVMDYENVKDPGEVVQELHICKGVGQGQQFKLNQEIGYYDRAMDTEYMNMPEEDVEEMPNYSGGCQGRQGKSKASKTKQDAEKLAIELLAKRAFTAVELRKKLSAKFPLNIVQAVIHDLKVRGLINDGLYAETFSQSRWTSSSWGPRRIKQALVMKGVSEVDMENAVKLVFEDGEDGSDQRSSLRLSTSSVEKLYVQASKQWQRSQNVPHETRKARVIRWLQYRGFDWGVISIILRKLESQNHP